MSSSYYRRLAIICIHFAATICATSLCTNRFPDDFSFGAGSAAYQNEGAWNEGGKAPSIWDTMTHDHPERIRDGKTGDVASDSYHKYKEDVQLLVAAGVITIFK